MLLRSNTFTSSGNTLLAPYDNVHKFAAIVLDDVERVVIGDSSLDASVDANEFSNSNCGIRAFNSSFELYNNHFSNITELDGEILEVDSKGACVSSVSRSDFNDRYCIIGNKDYNLSAPSQSHRNKFHSSVFGIVSRGEMNMKIFNNEFGNSATTSDALTFCGIASYNSANKKIYISRGNAFYDYNVGVKAFSIGTAGTYHIVDNDFVKATSSIPANPTSFQGTAIWAANPMRPVSLPNESYLQIINNRIGEPNNSQGRIGIFTSSIPVPQIQENKIYFQVSGAPASPTLGIWVQNSFDPKVINNEIINISNQTHGPSFTGIRSDMNTMGCFSLNKIQNMGYSFHFMGNHGQIGFAENEMNYYDHAIFLNNADIGVQGFADVLNNIYRTDDNEFIHNSIGLQPDRVVGNTFSGIPISWIFNNSNNLKYNPDINGSISTTLLDEQGATSSLGQGPIKCPEITNPTARNLAFGYIVRDTARYEELYASQFNYHSRQKLYEIIKYNSSIIDMNDSTDVYYESFYNEALESNLAKFESVRVYIESGDYPAAISLVNAIVDTNSIEEVCKYIYGIGINILPLDSTLSNSDSANFFEIGTLHALTTGDAAFITRNNLFYEVHDGVLGGGSRIAHLNISEPTSFTVALFPIPAMDMVSFTYKDIVPDAVEVSDIGQRCILNSTNIFQLNVASLPPGCYFVRFLQNNKVIGVKKLIKAR